MTEAQIDIVKGRIGEALVEALFREAGYSVCRSGRESNVQGLMKAGQEMTPDFVVFRPEGSGLYRMFHLEVKFRADVETFLKHEAKKGIDSAFEERFRWPELYYVLVTDQPKAGRSCFQVADLRRYRTGQEVETVDLADVSTLHVSPDIIRSYDDVVRQLFLVLHNQSQLARELGHHQLLNLPR